MAIRKKKQKAQVIAKLTEQAPAGETFLACVHCESGPSPYLGALFDEIPVLGFVIALSRKYYFLTLTNTSVVVNSANRFTNRPGEVVAAYSREAFPVTRIKRGRAWSFLYLEFPGSSKPTRLNIDRYWRSEFDQLVAAFPADKRQAVLDQDDQPLSA